MREKSLRSKEDIKDYFFMGMFVLGVIFLRIFYITRTTGPFIYGDEFGYWSHAAHMAGYTWAGVMSGLGWYAFGYSFWLALTFLFSENMVVMFRVAILINVLMSLGTYVLAYRIIKKLAVKKDTVICGAIALVATSFPTYIFYTYTTMAETLATLIIWLLFYEMISLEEKPVWWKGVLLGITAGYVYMVHNRMLTTVLAVGVCMIILWGMHKIDWKIMVAFVLSIMVMLLLYIVLKGYLEGMVEDNQAIVETGITVTRASQNSFRSVFKKFIKIFSPANIMKPLLSVMGQLWQCLSSSYLLIGFGVVYCICHLKKRDSEQQICAYVYPVLTLLFSVGLTAVVMRGPSLQAVQTMEHVRIDTAFYGRYNECYYPLLIIMGLIMLWEGKLHDVSRTFLGLVVVYFCLTMGVYFRISGIENGYLNIVSSISLCIFHWFGEFSVWKCCLTALVCGAVIVGLCCWKRIGIFAYYGGLLLTIFLFSTTALYCMRTSIRGENDYTLQYTSMYEYLDENMRERETMYMCGSQKAVFDMQTRLVDKIVVWMTPEQVAGIGEAAYVVVPEDQLKELDITDYDICMECQEYKVLKLFK